MSCPVPSCRHVSTFSDTCVFCAIVAGQEPATVVAEWHGALAIVPLNPVVEGHVIVIPKEHVAYATENAVIAGYVFQCAAELAPTPCNLITSAGGAATQTVFHLHVHIVPRAENDGLLLPWTPQQQPRTNASPEAVQ